MSNRRDFRNLMGRGMGLAISGVAGRSVAHSGVFAFALQTEADLVVVNVDPGKIKTVYEA